MQIDVLGAPHHPHPTLTQLGGDLEMRQGRADHEFDPLQVIVCGLSYANRPSVAYSTAQIAIHPYLGIMQPLRKEDVFTPFEPRTLEDSPWNPSSESSFDTFRGLLMAGALGLPMWAAVLLLTWWVWL
jgi:hypothetical protein